MKKIGLLAAMQIEVDAFLQRCSSYEMINYANHQFYQTTLANHEVIIGLCGVGKVNSACTTTLMIDHFNVDIIINIGTAGGLKDNENVLDVVVATQICEYDLDVIDWGKGYGNAKTCSIIDPTLLEIAKTHLHDEKSTIWFGPIATGDVFVCKDEHIKTIVDYYPESLAAEMEGGAIAKVCNSLNVPCLVIRSLSDIAVKEGNEFTFEQYAAIASQRSALWCETLINAL